MDNTDSSPNVPMDEQESDDGSDNGNYYLRLESPNPNNIDDLDDNDSHLHSLSSYANAHQVTNNTASNCSSNHQRRSIGGNDDDDDDDDQLDAFFFNDNNTNNAPIDDRHGPRPVSATSIASSFIEKASSVLQETSSAVQEVIKHRTFCGSTVTNTTTNKHAEQHDPSSFTAVPLRHIQSSPTQQHLLSEEHQQPIMKRSISTPLTFSQSRRGSAFGRVQSSSSLHEPIPIKTRTSAFDSVGGIGIGIHDSQVTPSSIKSVLSDASSSTTVATTNIVTASVPVPVSAIDELSVSSNKLTAQALKKIKERRRKKKSSLKNRSGPVKDSDNVQMKVQEGNEEETQTIMSSPNTVKHTTFQASPQHIHTHSASDSANEQERYTQVESNLSNGGLTESYKILNSGEWTYNTEGEDSLIGNKFGVGQIQMQIPSSPAPPSPSYQKFDDDHALTQVGMGIGADGHGHLSNPPLPYQRRSSINKNAHPLGTTRNHAANGKNVIKPKPRLVLPSTTMNAAVGSRSPCSQESSFFSKSTSKSTSSGNASSHTQYTLNSGNASTSGNRSVTSSVAEADKEVRDTNRREWRRFQKDDADGTMSVQSIQSSDTTSTNPHAYLALTSNSPHLREGANMQIERFFARNGSHASGGGGGFTTGSVSGYGRPPTMNSKSPANTISSNSISIGHSTSSGEDVPPQLIIKAKKVSGKKVLPFVAPLEGYSKLGLDGSIGPSSSSCSTSSKSSSSKSSKSHRKDRTRLYQKMRTSTPSPGPLNNSPYSSASPVKTPMTPISPHQFQSSIETRGHVTRPSVCRFPAHGGGGHHNLPSNKFHLVSPNHDGDVAVRRHGNIQQGAFRRARRTITPERNRHE